MRPLHPSTEGHLSGESFVLNSGLTPRKSCNFTAVRSFQQETILGANTLRTRKSLRTKNESVVPGGEVEPPRAEARRILSTQKGSAPFGKFSTLLYSSTGYKSATLNRYDPICTALTIELLQFYYSSVQHTGNIEDVARRF
jgi:hypothetical protein